MTRVIGINSEFNASMDHIYSGSSALIENNKIIYAIAEERISKIKHAGGFLESLQEIYQKTGLSKDDIDYFSISFYANALIPEEDMIKKHLELLDITDTPKKLIVVPSHHLSHAYLAYFLSPLTSAVIMVADNEGSLLYPREAVERNIINNYCERNSYYWAKGNNIVLIGRDFDSLGQVAFGKAYNKFNEYIGFGSYLNAGKTMGLSSYGHAVPQYANLDLWGIDKNGRLSSYMSETYDSFRDIKTFFKKNGVDVPEISDHHAYNAQEYKDLAYFIQSQLNKWSVKKADYLCRITGIKNLCFSGGVALNSVMNSEIENKLNTCVFVPPYPSDPGQALGNAIYGLVIKTDLSNNVTLPKYSVEQYTYLGTSYSNDDILKHIEMINLNNKKYSITSETNICMSTAKMLNNGKIIGWFQGRSEYGARALGNRSILSNPNTSEMRDRINILKGRELFRPLAPSVLSEDIEEFFIGKVSILDRHMLRVMEVRNEKRNKIPAVVHIDGTARLQEVTQDSNPLFYDLISEFKKISGIPLLINTSFNAAGDPIVESPIDAIKAFTKMNLDALVCNNIMITKE